MGAWNGPMPDGTPVPGAPVSRELDQFGGIDFPIELTAYEAGPEPRYQDTMQLWVKGLPGHEDIEGMPPWSLECWQWSADGNELEICAELGQPTFAEVLAHQEREHL